MRRLQFLVIFFYSTFLFSFVYGLESQNRDFSSLEEYYAFIEKQSDLQEINGTEITSTDDEITNGIETKAGYTALVKKAIRIALKNEKSLIQAVEKAAGKGAALQVAKLYDKARPVLLRLLKWDTLIWTNVQDQLAGVIGRAAAVFLVEGLKFLV